MKKQHIIIVIVAAFILVFIGFKEGVITGNLIKENNEKIIIYFPEVGDFKNNKEGGMTFDFSFPSSEFKVKNKTADLLMFHDSETIPGLKIGYDTKQQKIYAGLPMMLSDKINIMDGKPHKLIYAFNSNEKKQIILFDGKPVAEGEFTGKTEKNPLTGFVIQENFKYIESPVNIDVRIE